MNPNPQGWMLLNAAGLALVLTVAHAILKWATREPHASFIELLGARGGWVIVALALYGGVFLWYLDALRRFQMSLLFPLYTGLTLVLVSVAGVVVFGERLALPQVAGIALIIAGMFLLQRGA